MFTHRCVDSSGVQMPSSTNVDTLRLELIQRGVSVSHPLIQGKIKIHPELQADISAMFYYYAFEMLHRG